MCGHQDGFLSTSNDGGTWGAQYSRAGWQVNTDADSAPFPKFGSSVAGSATGIGKGAVPAGATPIFQSAHGPMVDPDFAFAARESAWVPIDGEMFWFAGKAKTSTGITAELAAWRLREMHYTTLSLVHGFAKLDSKNAPAATTVNETITRWTRTPLDVTRLRQDRLPISPAYAAVPHTGFEYVRDHLGYRLELQWAAFADTITPGAPLTFRAGLVNWGFAAPINPRPVLLVLLAADSSTIVWRSGSTMADVRDWQPHIPGDPTFSALEHTLTSHESLPAAVCAGATSLQLGVFMPDARMNKLVETEAMAAAFSLRLANADVGWQTVKSEGAVNILANVTCAGQ